MPSVRSPQECEEVAVMASKRGIHANPTETCLPAYDFVEGTEKDG